MRSGAVDVIAVDSVAALTPRVELEGQMGDQSVGLQARMMSQAMRKLAGNLNRANTVCLFTNQIREKIGVTFGSPETQPGGRALKFYSSQRLDIRRIETLKEGTEAVGNRVRIKVVKNKVAPPFRQAEFDIEYGVGISHEGCLLDLALEHDLIQKSGSFFSYGELRLGQGRNNTKGYLAENPELAQEIETKIFELLGLERKPRPIAAVPDAPRGRRRSSGRDRRRRRRARAQGGVATDGRVQWPGARKAAFELALRALSRKEHTVAELRAWLAKREADPAEAEEAIERLIEVGQLDDERYAELFSQDKRELFGWGPGRIREALVEKGVARSDSRGGSRRRERGRARRAGSGPARSAKRRPRRRLGAGQGARLPRAPRLRVGGRLRGGAARRAPRSLSAEPNHGGEALIASRARVYRRCR